MTIKCIKTDLMIIGDITIGGIYEVKWRNDYPYFIDDHGHERDYNKWFSLFIEIVEFRNKRIDELMK